MIKVAVPGVNGRMGATIVESLLRSKDMQLTVATARQLSDQKVANSDVTISNQLNDNFDVLIDFTLPAGLMQHLEFCLQHKKAMVIGTTGCNADELAIIKNAAQTIPILMSANMSIGVNICFKMLANAAQMFDENWNIAIVDVHHKHKKDTPSGTAKQMLKILKDNHVAKDKEIAIQSERHGDIIGSHAVSFTNPFEEIVISHFARDRKIFAEGAVMAARWIHSQQPGLYSIQDII